MSAGRDIGQQRGAGGGEGTLPVELCCQVVPVLQTDLKDLRLLHLRHQQHVVQGLETGPSALRSHNSSYSDSSADRYSLGVRTQVRPHVTARRDTSLWRICLFSRTGTIMATHHSLLIFLNFLCQI